MGIIPILVAVGRAKQRAAALLGFAAVFVMGSVACGSTGSGSSIGIGSGAGEGGGIEIVASFYPLAEAAQRVGGERVDVANLTPPGVEPHDLELTPDQVEGIATADLVLYLGGGFQPAVEDAVASVAEGEAVDVLAGLSATQVSTTGGEPEQEGGVLDPHVWLSPVLMQQVVDRVQRALSEADPSGGAEFRANADVYEAELAALDRDFRVGLANCQRTVLVTSHAAFAHLAAEYGFEQKAVTGLSPSSEPDPARLAELAEEVRADGTTTIFSETLVSPEVAEALARETGASTAVLDPIEGLTDEQLEAGEDYFSVMRRNLEALRRGLGCT